MQENSLQLHLDSFHYKVHQIHKVHHGTVSTRSPAPAPHILTNGMLLEMTVSLQKAGWIILGKKQTKWYSISKYFQWACPMCFAMWVLVEDRYCCSLGRWSQDGMRSIFTLVLTIWGEIVCGRQFLAAHFLLIYQRDVVCLVMPNAVTIYYT